VGVAAEVAQVLNAELDIALVRKLGVPGREELAFGAIATGNVRILNHEILQQFGMDRRTVEQITERAKVELLRRERLLREGRPPIPVHGRHVILIDDGLATGASMLAAARALWPQGAKSVTVAVPVASRQAFSEFQHEVNRILCAAMPEPFGAVGRWYVDFAQVSDEEVRMHLEQATHRVHSHPSRFRKHHSVFKAG
jgi:putative phosphoribosyl transferase